MHTGDLHSSGQEWFALGNNSQHDLDFYAGNLTATLRVDRRNAKALLGIAVVPISRLIV